MVLFICTESSVSITLSKVLVSFWSNSKIFSKSAINLTGGIEHCTKTGTKLVVNVVSTYFLGLNWSKFNYVQLLLNDISSGIGNKINVKPVDKHLDE